MSQLRVGRSSALRVALAALTLALACRGPAPLAKAPVSKEAQKLRAAREPLDPRRLKGAGPFGESLVLTVEPGVAGDRVTSLLEVPEADCAAVIARGSESIEDLDLLAYAEDGAPLGSDEAPDREPSLLICPPHPQRVLLVARIAQGHGIVAIGSERVKPEHAAKAAQRYAVKSRDPSDANRLKAWPGLDALIVEERARIGGKFQDLRRVALALDASVPTTLPATIDAGRCVHGLFIPSDDVSHLEVTARDDQGRVLGRAAGSGRQRSLVVCSPVATDISFEIRPHAGRGLAVAALSRSVAGSEGDIAGEVLRHDVYPSADAQSELKALGARLARLGYGAPPRVAAQLNLAVGQRTSSRLTLPGGCTRVDIVGGLGLRGIDARLWTDSGELRAASSAGGSATLFDCGGGKRRLDTSALIGPGPAIAVTSDDADVPPELTRHPLAGGRLVGRMVSRGVLLRPSAIGKVTELALRAEQLVSLPVMVPHERCVDVNVALEGGAAGVELRAVDDETGMELDSAVGEVGASTRLCSYNQSATGSLRASVELRAVSGNGLALAATRLLTPAE